MSPKDTTPKLHTTPTLVVREVEPEDPSETHVEQLVAELEPIFVTPQSAWTDHLESKANTLFFSVQFTELAFSYLYLLISLPKVHWNFTTFPEFLTSFHVPIFDPCGTKVRTTFPRAY